MPFWDQPPETGYMPCMIGFLVAGLIIGLLARLILPGKQHIGLLWTLALGVVGSVIGGTIANALDSGDIWELNFVGFVAAVAVSVGVLAIAERAGLGAGDDRRDLPGRT
jgi:uncharacterized membrane protein YeaQ/YmgE (transglycosylase-associated protein family)